MTTQYQHAAQLSTLSNAAYSDNPPLVIGDWKWVDTSPADVTSGYVGVAYQNNLLEIKL